jgi:hypothetical protein
MSRRSNTSVIVSKKLGHIHEEPAGAVADGHGVAVGVQQGPQLFVRIMLAHNGIPFS